MIKTISLSKHLGVERKELEEVGVFDATLGIDTELFVDPKLLVNSDIEEFKKSREKILRYFGQLLKVHKQSPKAPRLRDEARDMLAVPEPEGLSIGYGSKTDNGTSIAKNVANRILLSASEILSVGIEDSEVVELLGLFVPGFGPDSMSDLIIHIIYEDFCSYTARISKEIGLKTKEYKIEGVKYLLPTHPFSGEQIIFVPHTFLRVLPIATSYDEIADAAKHNEELRKQFDQIVFPALKEVMSDITSKSKEEIDLFKKDLSSLLDIYRKIEVDSYNLERDDRGYYRIDPFVEKESVNIHSRLKPKNGGELIESVKELISQFKRSIEDNGGNNLLYRRTDTNALLKDKPHNEDVAQRIFYMIADLFCQQADILLSGESDAGRGPVDFSLGTGYSEKVLVEIKKSDNKNIENGYKEQVEAYQKSENALQSFYVVILVKETKKIKDHATQLDVITNLYNKNKKEGVKTPELIIIDGIVHPSPSKLKSL
jgi:hypothetical protein